MREQAGATPYRVEIDDEDWAALAALNERQQETVLRFLKEHASRTPTQHIPGKLKQLRGEHKGIFQFSIDRDYRLLYTVDEDSRRVLVEYIGYHPDWRKSRGGRGIRR